MGLCVFGPAAFAALAMEFRIDLMARFVQGNARPDDSIQSLHPVPVVVGEVAEVAGIPDHPIVVATPQLTNAVISSSSASMASRFLPERYS